MVVAFSQRPCRDPQQRDTNGTTKALLRKWEGGLHDPARPCMGLQNDPAHACMPVHAYMRVWGRTKTEALECMQNAPSLQCGVDRLLGICHPVPPYGDTNQRGVLLASVDI